MKRFLLAALLAGCAPEPLPESIRVDVPEALMPVVLDVLDAWGDATGWRPEIRPDGEAAIRAATFERSAKAREGEENPGRAVGHTILLDPGIADHPPEYAWTIVAHEIGHWGIGTGRHIEASALMSERVCIGYEDCVTSIDDEAIEAWCEVRDCLR